MDERRAVVEAARKWIGTPYHHNAMVPHAGIDCATLLVASFKGAGLIGDIQLPLYSPQWHLHRDEDKYLDFIKRFCVEVERPPIIGDIVVWKFHRCFSHGAIVVDWPTVIHAFIGSGCMEDDAVKNRMLATVSERTPLQGQPRPMKTLSFWR